MDMEHMLQESFGAVGNNGKGVVGVNWNVKILPCNAFDPLLGGFFSFSDY